MSKRIGTVLRAVVALPRQLGAVWRGYSNRGAASHDEAVAGTSPMRRALIGIPIALVMNLAALAVVFVVARARRALLAKPWSARGAARGPSEQRLRTGSSRR